MVRSRAVTRAWPALRAVRHARALPIVALCVLGGCAVADSMKPVAGTDLSAVKPGATRDQVERVLGKPERDWSTPLDVHYRIYSYKLPRAHQGFAVLPLMLDIATLGAYEGIHQVAPEGSAGMQGNLPPTIAKLAVAYDVNDIVLDVFKKVGEFDRLPDNGLHP